MKKILDSISAKTVSRLLVICTILLAVIGAAGFYFSSQVINPVPYGYEKTWKTEIDTGKIRQAQWNSWEKEELYIESPHGYKLHGFYFPLKNSKKTVIIVHGHNYSGYGSAKYIPIFRKRGYNTVIFDNRANKKSGGKHMTFGYYEKDDLKAWIDWVHKKTGTDTIIGLHGESMGAAISLLTAAEDKRIAFIVSDCAFSDLSKMLRFRMKTDFGLPAFPLYHAASFMSKIRGAMYFSEVSPIKIIAQVEIPVFFVHGKDDDFTPPEMTEKLFEAKTKGIKKLYLAPKAKHAMSFWKNQKEYDRLVGEFLASF